MHVKAFFLSSCRNNILHIDLAHYNISYLTNLGYFQVLSPVLIFSQKKFANEYPENYLHPLQPTSKKQANHVKNTCARVKF